MIGLALFGLFVFIAYKTNPHEQSFRQQKTQKWLPRFLSREERYSYVNYQIFGILTQNDGQVFLGVLGIWLPLITKEPQAQPNMPQSDMFRDRAIQAKSKRDFTSAASYFQQAASSTIDGTEKAQLLEEVYKCYKAANDNYRAIQALESAAKLYERDPRMRSRAARSYEQLSQLTISKPLEHMKYLKMAADMFTEQDDIRGLTFNWQLVVYGLSHSSIANKDALELLERLKQQPRYQEVFQFRIPEIELVKCLLKMTMGQQVHLQEQFDEFPAFANSREGAICQRLLNSEDVEQDIQQPQNDLTQWKLKVIRDHSSMLT